MHSKQALQETIAIWDALARSGSDKKEDALTETGLLHAANYDSTCPLCEHAVTLNWCWSCLVWGEKGYRCHQPGEGEYWRWMEAGSPEGRKYYAKKIADMAREALDKLGTEK